MPDVQKIAVTAPIVVEVLAPAAPSHGIKVREVDGGAVLDVPKDVRRRLIEFGWLPPVDDADVDSE